MANSKELNGGGSATPSLPNVGSVIKADTTLIVALLSSFMLILMLAQAEAHVGISYSGMLALATIGLVLTLAVKNAASIFGVGDANVTHFLSVATLTMLIFLLPQLSLGFRDMQYSVKAEFVSYSVSFLYPIMVAVVMGGIATILSSFFRVHIEGKTTMLYGAACGLIVLAMFLINF